MNDTTKKYALAQSVLLVAFAMISLALVYTVTILGKPAKAPYFSSLAQGENTKEVAKQAVLDWMGENSAMPDQVLAKVYNAAATTGYRDLILAICLVESNFNPKVESGKGAIGLMGIMPDVWLDELKAQGIIRKKEDLYKISTNIAAGAYVLARYLSETNDLNQALIRYVGGASQYAVRVLQVHKKIKLTQNSDPEPVLAGS